MNTDKLHPVTAIKLFRMATGEGLFESKKLVESLSDSPLRCGVNSEALGRLIHNWYHDHNYIEKVR